MASDGDCLTLGHRSDRPQPDAPGTDQGGSANGHVPQNLEVLIRMARQVESFKELLLAKRAAAEEIDLQLDSAEAAMIDGVAAHLLEQTIVRRASNRSTAPHSLAKSLP